jgi:hypothetical protein
MELVECGTNSMDDNRDFLFIPLFFRHANGGAKQTNYGSTRSVEEKNKED